VTEHPIPPVYDENSRILILGSFPSVLSREVGFFYGNPRNRFWQVLAAVRGAPCPGTTEEKKAFLLRERIALWDAAAACEIRGSADSAMKEIRPTDLSPILRTARIVRICLNGGKAAGIYEKYIKRPGMPEAVRLPSTSPANASFSLGALTERWREALCPPETGEKEP